MTHNLLCIIIGLVAGAASGLLGIGGGIVIIPMLLFVLNFTQHQAQGTTLALMVPPIGLLAAWTYYQQGHVDLKIASLICVGFFIGGLIGARVAVGLDTRVLEKIFGAAMLILSIKMLLK
jgi:uncharacterized protein